MRCSRSVIIGLGFALLMGCFEWTEDSQGNLRSVGVPGLPVGRRNQPQRAKSRVAQAMLRLPRSTRRLPELSAETRRDPRLSAESRGVTRAGCQSSCQLSALSFQPDISG
jgi:hypothetical protein